MKNKEEKKTKYTKFIHVENGRPPIVRRIHRVEVQAANGVIYTLRDDKLPPLIQTYSGMGREGQNLAQILVSPRKERLPYSPPVAEPWPTRRDVFNWVIGIAMLGLLNFAFHVLSFT